MRRRIRASLRGVTLRDGREAGEAIARRLGAVPAWQRAARVVRPGLGVRVGDPLAGARAPLLQLGQLQALRRRRAELRELAHHRAAAKGAPPARADGGVLARATSLHGVEDDVAHVQRGGGARGIRRRVARKSRLLARRRRDRAHLGRNEARRGTRAPPSLRRARGPHRGHGGRGRGRATPNATCFLQGPGGRHASSMMDKSGDNLSGLQSSVWCTVKYSQRDFSRSLARVAASRPRLRLAIAPRAAHLADLTGAVGAAVAVTLAHRTTTYPTFMRKTIRRSTPTSSHLSSPALMDS